MEQVKPESRDERVMGRPSQGRSVRLQATITPGLQMWLDSQRHAGESLSDVVFRLLNEFSAHSKTH